MAKAGAAGKKKPPQKKKKPAGKGRLRGLLQQMKQNREMTYEEKREKDLKRLSQLKKTHKPFRRFVMTVVIHVKAFLHKNTEDNINALSGQSAFFIILSTVPILMFLLALISLLGGKPDDEAFRQALEQSSVPAGAAVSSLETASSQSFFYQFLIDSYRYASSGTVIITAVVALWSAGKGLYIITDGISRIYRIPQKHFWILRRVFAMGYTAVLLLMLAVSIGLLVLNTFIDVAIGNVIDGIPFTTELLLGLRYVITTVLQILFLTLALKLYLRRKVEDKRYAKFRVLLPGMTFTSLAWNILAWLVSLYSKYFSGSMYGSLGSVFITMMWIYFMMLLLLYGVQINYIYREQFCNFRFRKAFGALRQKLARKKNQKTAKAASE